MCMSRGSDRDFESYWTCLGRRTTDYRQGYVATTQVKDLNMVREKLVSATVWFLFLVLQVSCEYGILSAKSPHTTEKMFCLSYNPLFQKLPDSQKEAKKYQMLDLMPSLGCKPPVDKVSMTDKVVFIKRGNCTFVEKAEIIFERGGVAMIAVSSSGVDSPGVDNVSDYNRINMTVATMDNQDYQSLKGLGQDVEVQLFVPSEAGVDYNLIVIWLIAMVTIIIGGGWSGIVKYRSHIRKKLARSRGIDEDGRRKAVDDDNTFDVSLPFVLVFVFLMIAMLVALYFFYDYLVYAVIALFGLASCIALHGCFEPMVLKLPCGSKRIPPNPLPLLSSRPAYVSVVLFFVSVLIVIWWGIERNSSYAWILQDILGVAFCIHMLKTIRLPSLKACTILLVLLFIYDIFFVFITPYFTKSHQSVMIDVATGHGGKSSEQLPMVFKVPRFAPSAMTVCHLPYSLLGFGDILVPGMLVAYCHGFDLRVQTRWRIYFLVTTVAYGLGLIVTFTALIFMATGQPALLYLVPFTLIPTFIISWKRSEFSLIWNGIVEKRSENTLDDIEYQVDLRESPTSVVTTNGNTASINNRRLSPSSSQNGGSDTENEHLLTGGR